MTSISTRASVLGVKAEVTEGTPVLPASTSDFLPIQDDFTMTPEFELLENNELKNSLGKSKGIIGGQNPKADFSHFLKHSGVEGQAPKAGTLLLKSIFGTDTVLATEHDTVAGSTTSVVKVNTGEGASHLRGSALLIKDPVNGYSIRPVHSVSTDDLSLGFNLAVAPGTGVNLGKHITYSPAESGFQSLTLSHYVGNGGAQQVMAGSRLVSAEFSMEAAKFINAKYSLEGLSYYFNPVTIAAADTYIDFTDDNGTYAATVAAQLYSDPHKLAEAIAAALNLADPLETFTCVYSDTTGKYTIATSTSTLLTLKFATGTNTANTIANAIGFTVADKTTATTYTAEAAISFAAPYTPAYDTSDPQVAKGNQLFIGDADDALCVNASKFSVKIDLPKANIMSICAESGKSGSVPSSRTVVATVSALLDKYDADKYARLRANSDTRLCYIFGEKTGTNWKAGTCGCFYMPTCTITSLTPIEDADGLVAFTAEFSAFVDSNNNGEVYLSFV